MAAAADMSGASMSNYLKAQLSISTASVFFSAPIKSQTGELLIQNFNQRAGKKNRVLYLAGATGRPGTTLKPN